MYQQPQQNNVLSPASNAVTTPNNFNFDNTNNNTLTQSSSSTTQGAMPLQQSSIPLSTPMDNIDSNDNVVTAKQPKDKIIVPRSAWKTDDDDNNSGNSKKSLKQKLLDKRGDYKCSKCGEPKRGHVCRNKPRVRAAFVEKRDASIQAQLDPNMTISNLNRSLQGYPLSYGFNNTWPAINPINPYYRMIPNLGQMNNPMMGMNPQQMMMPQPNMMQQNFFQPQQMNPQQMNPQQMNPQQLNPQQMEQMMQMVQQQQQQQQQQQFNQQPLMNDLNQNSTTST